MHDKIILDSCVIAAIFLPETMTGKAIDAAAGHTCITVDLAYTEVSTAAWKRVVHAGNDPELIRTYLENAIAFIDESCEVIPAQDLITPAWTLSCHLRITMYDALFVAASVRCDAPLVTADARLAGAVSETCPVILIKA
ncbi:MAG: type II toxin-antitoxin system VapC family toxin [Methanoregula sp.]|nr:type II toxin-antitoxin system VapC family toxin [Methanoregula sp.]